MAAHVKYARYGEVQGYDGKQGGWFGFAYDKAVYDSVPSVGTEFIGISPAITIGNFTINAIVSILPTGLNQKPRRYFTDATVDTLNTGGA